MKKILLLLAMIGMFGFQGCSDNSSDNIDYDTIATAYETDYVDFLPDDYKIRYYFPREIYASDMVLVYRLAGTVNGKDLWEFLPETYYFADGTRDFSYNFNFTSTFVDIYLSGNELGSVPAGNRLDQIFRIVVVPADLSQAVDKNNYDQVVKTLKLNENQIQQIHF